MLGIIGGSGLVEFAGLEDMYEKRVSTPYGEPSAPLVFGRLHGQPVAFLARHGRPHAIPPHCVNYRANVYALREAGVKEIIAINAVGGISDVLETGAIVVPHQIIDYTWGRAHTYSDSASVPLQHVDFTEPYTELLRQRLMAAGRLAGLDIVQGAVYAAMQGPRLETAAEIRRLAADGCDIVGMTGMPEAVLARELHLGYASVALVVNMAAGISEIPLAFADMEKVMHAGMTRIRQLLEAFCREAEAGG